MSPDPGAENRPGRKTGRPGRARSGKKAGTAWTPPDYRVWHLTLEERVKYTLEGAAGIAAIAWIFYRSVLFFLLLLPAAFLLPCYMKDVLRERRQRTLLLEFREALSVLSGSLSAGYSLENAVGESTEELRMIFPEDAPIVREFDHINHLCSMNIPVEHAVDDLAERSGLDDIRNFARVLRLAKRSGGELVSVISHTTDTISDRIQVREDILTMTASRRFEQRIMNLMPALIILYVDLTSPGFFTVMYTTAAGRIVMTVCLLVWLAAVKLSNRIMRIEV